MSQDNARLAEGLASLYLGKYCPLAQMECCGIACSFFLVTQQVGPQGRAITGGACCIPLIASQVGPIADGLMRVAQAAGEKPLSTIIPAR